MHGERTQAVKSSVKPATPHGIMDPLRSVHTSDQKHSDHICISAVCVKAGFWFKASNFHGVGKPYILAVDNMNISKRKKEKVDDFFGHFKLVHGMGDGDCGCGKR